MDRRRFEGMRSCWLVLRIAYICGCTLGLYAKLRVAWAREFQRWNVHENKADMIHGFVAREELASNTRRDTWCSSGSKRKRERERERENRWLCLWFCRGVGRKCSPEFAAPREHYFRFLVSHSFVVSPTSVPLASLYD